MKSLPHLKRSNKQQLCLTDQEVCGTLHFKGGSTVINIPSPKSEKSRFTRRTFFGRLRPFLRRDARSRIISGVVAAAILMCLSWLGISSLTQMDSREAQQFRISLGIEDWDQVCETYPNKESEAEKPRCTYDDKEQAEVDRIFAGQQRIRLAVLTELESRLTNQITNLTTAESILRHESIALHQENLLGGNQYLIELLLTPVDLRPLFSEAENADRIHRLQRASYSLDVEQDGTIIVGSLEPLFNEIHLQRRLLRSNLEHVKNLIARDQNYAIDTSVVHRSQVWAKLMNPDADQQEIPLATWLISAGGPETISTTLANLAQSSPEELAQAIFHPTDSIWQGAFAERYSTYQPIHKPSIRYRSPVQAHQRWQLIGTLLVGLASFMFLLVGPVVTATHTAREREAGTLPVLRMTGLSGGDLAWAMAVGPNLFALIAGGLLLTLGTWILAFTSGWSAVLVVLALLILLASTTHLIAMGLGDALGHRVNALIVGAIVAVLITVPGLIGAGMVAGDIAYAGMLLGPIPATFAGVLSLSGLSGTEHLLLPYSSEFYVSSLLSSYLNHFILLFSLGGQVLLAMLCVISWQRRVDQAWTPLFRPQEGIALALASVGCSALTLLDLSARVNAQSFDSLNLVTLLACMFLLPLFGWLVITSLPRPARANAVATHVETRRAFWRFQGVLAIAVAVVSAAYFIMMQRTGLTNQGSELMWSTLTQVFLVIETTIAALLWLSRKKTNKIRIAMVSAALILLQVLFAGFVYRAEVDYVALTHQAGLPFLLGMEASPYWIGLMILLWGAGLGLIIAALLRARDRNQQQNNRSEESQEDSSDDDEQNRGRWLH